MCNTVRYIVSCVACREKRGHSQRVTCELTLVLATCHSQLGLLLSNLQMINLLCQRLLLLVT